MIDLKHMYRLKDKRADFFKCVKFQGERGVTLHKAQAIATLWCYTQNLSGDIVNSRLVIENKETRLFIFNFRADIAQGDFVRYRDSWYEITRVNTTDDYNDELYSYVRDCRKPVAVLEGGDSDGG